MDTGHLRRHFEENFLLVILSILFLKQRERERKIDKLLSGS